MRNFPVVVVVALAVAWGAVRVAWGVGRAVWAERQVVWATRRGVGPVATRKRPWPKRRRRTYR
jgi:hypothetical protein